MRVKVYKKLTLEMHRLAELYVASFNSHWPTLPEIRLRRGGGQDDRRDVTPRMELKV